MTQMKYIGLDVHKETVTVAIAEGNARCRNQFYGTIPTAPEALRRLFARLADAGMEFTGASAVGIVL